MQDNTAPRQKPAKTMRNYWFEFVATIRRKLSRKAKKNISHKEAMQEASKLWPKEKLKIQNRLRREERKASKAAALETSS